MHSASYLVMCLGDFNGLVGRHIDGFDEAHGGYGIGQINLKERMFCLEKELSVSNTLFMREEKRKVTFRIGKNEARLTLC